LQGGQYKDGDPKDENQANGRKRAEKNKGMEKRELPKKGVPKQNEGSGTRVGPAMGVNLGKRKTEGALF